MDSKSSIQRNFKPNRCSGWQELVHRCRLGPGIHLFGRSDCSSVANGCESYRNRGTFDQCGWLVVVPGMDLQFADRHLRWRNLAFNCFHFFDRRGDREACRHPIGRLDWASADLYFDAEWHSGCLHRVRNAKALSSIRASIWWPIVEPVAVPFHAGMQQLQIAGVCVVFVAAILTLAASLLPRRRDALWWKLGVPFLITYGILAIGVGATFFGSQEAIKVFQNSLSNRSRDFAPWHHSPLSNQPYS